MPPSVAPSAIPLRRLATTMRQRFQLSEAELWTRSRDACLSATPRELRQAGAAVLCRRGTLRLLPFRLPQGACTTDDDVDETFLAAGAGAAGGVCAVLSPGVIVEQRSWNSALALVSWSALPRSACVMR